MFGTENLFFFWVAKLPPLSLSPSNHRDIPWNVPPPQAIIPLYLGIFWGKKFSQPPIIVTIFLIVVRYFIVGITFCDPLVMSL